MENYGLKYYAEFRSKHAGNYWRVEILQRNYTGSPLEMRVSSNALTITYDKKGDPLYEVFKSSQCELTIQCSQNNQYIDLFTQDNFTYMVRVYRNTCLHWKGWLCSDEYSEEYNAAPFDFTIRAIDGFDLLKSIPFKQTRLQNYTGFDSLKNVIIKCLSDIEDEINACVDVYEKSTTKNKESFEQVYIDYDAVYRVYPDITKYDMLELILKPFALQIFNSNGHLAYRRISLLATKNINRPYRYNHVIQDVDKLWVARDNSFYHPVTGNRIVTETMMKRNITEQMNKDLRVSGTMELVQTAKSISVTAGVQSSANAIYPMGFFDCAKWSDIGAAHVYDNNNMRPYSIHIVHNNIADTTSVFQYQNLCSTSFKLKFVFDLLAGQPHYAAVKQNMNFKFSFEVIGSGVNQHYYLGENGDWVEAAELEVTPPLCITKNIQINSKQNIVVDMNNIPCDGIFKFTIYILTENFLSWFWMDNVSFSYDNDNDVKNSYFLDINDRNADNIEVDLALTDIVNYPNSNIFSDLFFYVEHAETLPGKKPSQAWMTETSSVNIPLVQIMARNIALFKNRSLTSIQAKIFSKLHLDLNSIIIDPQYQKAYYINQYSHDTLNEEYSAELCEIQDYLVDPDVAEGDDCELLRTFNFDCIQAVKCGPSIILRDSYHNLYIYDTISKKLEFFKTIDANTKLNEGYGAFVIYGLSLIAYAYDYQGNLLKTMQTYPGNYVFWHHEQFNWIVDAREEHAGFTIYKYRYFNEDVHNSYVQSGYVVYKYNEMLGTGVDRVCCDKYTVSITMKNTQSSTYNVYQYDYRNDNVTDFKMVQPNALSGAISDWFFIYLNLNYPARVDIMRRGYNGEANAVINYFDNVGLTVAAVDCSIICLYDENVGLFAIKPDDVYKYRVINHTGSYDELVNIIIIWDQLFVIRNNAIYKFWGWQEE